MELSKDFLSKRLAYGLAAAVVFIIECLIALYVHDQLIRPYLGDSLAVVLVYLGLRAVSPVSVAVALAIALGTAVFLEFGQAFNLLGALGLSHSHLARVVLGSGFDAKDFMAYGLGAGMVWLVEARRKHTD